MIWSRLASTFAVIGLIAGLSSFTSFAQSPAATKAADKSSTTEKATTPAQVAKKKSDPSRRVPDYFGQIGLNNEQRESIYKVRKTHQEKLDALRKQIGEVEAKSMAECEAVLTETQKKLLDNLRAGSGNARGTTKTADTVKTSTDSAKPKN